MFLNKADDPDRRRRDVRILGWFGLLVASLCWCAYLMNLQSRMNNVNNHDISNWSFLGWMAAYFTVTGAGLVMLRKWALLLSFLPAIASIITYVIGCYKKGMPSVSSIFIVVCIAGVMILVPGDCVRRSWRLLHW
jgi:hypothetical protein